MRGDEGNVRRLIKARANVDHVRNKGDFGDWTALQSAAEVGYVGIVRLLLNAGATIDLNAAFGERAGELKKPAKRLALIDLGLVSLFMM